MLRLVGWETLLHPQRAHETREIQVFVLVLCWEIFKTLKEILLIDGSSRIFLFLCLLLCSSFIFSSAKGLEKRAPEADLCPTCVSFLTDALDELIEIIANAGVLGTCSGLCGQLSNQIESTVCNLICDYVGITAFVDIITAADPDPIFYCEEMDICPIQEHAKGTITKVQVTPSSGPAGTTFNFLIQYQITNATGTGTLEIDIFPPATDGGYPFGDVELLLSQPPGTYRVEFQLAATPSEQEGFTPGAYKTKIQLCEGACDSQHSYSYLLDMKNTQFTITG